MPKSRSDQTKAGLARSRQGLRPTAIFATSQEELQSLNAELTALNGQLHETLEQQRITSNDLQNILNSTDVATLFLDQNLSIRFYTPATKALFDIIPSDLGRPLSALNALAADADLSTDAMQVLQTSTPIEREIETQNGTCFIRRVLPYRTQDNRVEGVVITFADITDSRQVSDKLNVAKRQAELATAAKSRFLAAASHDLRQPLQTLALLQGLLTKHVDTEKARNLIARLDETVGAMSGMLNVLLDINQIETGTVHAEMTQFPVNDLLQQLRDEFIYHAQAKGLVLRVMPCARSISSDPRLLEQMIRNLISNALKYTPRGKILVGCRVQGELLKIQVWDTGIGIPENELTAIFEEYHQLDNPARERVRGLGLGLSIVNRLGALLSHPVQVRSRLGHGSVFSIDIALAPGESVTARNTAGAESTKATADKAANVGAILLIEDDPDVRDLLELLLKDAGHDVLSAPDGVIALGLVENGAAQPDLILADYNLPNGMDGVRTTLMLRETLRRPVPAIILTGDISTLTAARIAIEHCMQLNKPVKPHELIGAIKRLMPSPRDRVGTSASRPALLQHDPKAQVVYVVDDDDTIRGAIRTVLEDENRTVQDFASCEAFLAAYRPRREACLVIDAYLPGMSGLTLLSRLHDGGHRLPAIMITGNSDVAMAVQAMKAGAADFIEKPIGRTELLACVDRALERSRDASKLTAWRDDAAVQVEGLTARQRQIMEMILAGHPNKNIAADLGISQRTVENHRASIMRKTGAKSLPALARLAMAAKKADAPDR